MSESKSMLPAMLDTASDIGLLILLFPLLVFLVVIGPGLFIWFFNPWGVIFAIMFYNVPFVCLGIAVYKNPENKGLWWLWVFQMVTAYFGVLLVVPME